MLTSRLAHHGPGCDSDGSTRRVRQPGIQDTTYLDCTTPLTGASNHTNASPVDSGSRHPRKEET